MTPGAAYPARAVRSATSKPVILCVDDVPEILDTLEEQLYARLGRAFRIEKAASGEEALEYAQELLAEGKELAVIIADVIMPGMKGDELLIRAHQLSPGTRKIMLTGEPGTTQHITNAINHGNLYRFIAKPWEMTDIQMTVEEAARSYLRDIQLEEQNQTLRLLHEAAQLLARQRNLDDLVPALLRLALQYSGAERAALVSVAGQQEPQLIALQVPGQALIEKRMPLASAGQDLAVGVVEEALRGEQVHIEDVALSPYAAHAYASQHNPRTLLAMPLLNQGKVMGVLYLEHRSAAQVFTPLRIETLGILTAQAAIALDHAFLTEHLETAVFDRTQELLAVSSHKDEMVRIVSHDIRSPLTGIASLAGLLRDPDIAGNAAEVARYGELLQRSTSTALKLVNDILDLAKLQSGTILLSRSETDLAELLRQTTDVFQPLVFTKRQQLQVDAPVSVSLSIDDSKLQQALHNLLSNAVKFTPAGGHILLALTVEATQALIHVADSGIGIPSDQLPRLFEKFGAKQRLGTAGERGTGLGLSIAREIVLLHGGSIEAQSEVGKGTRFTIRIPRD